MKTMTTRNTVRLSRTEDGFRWDANRASSALRLTIFRASRTALLLASVLSLSIFPVQAGPKQDSAPAETNSQLNHSDGQHDFDFAIGRWKTHLSRLQHPLTGSKTWIEYEGSATVRQVWNGRANLEEFEANGAAGHIQGLTLRLYHPQSRQWSQSWSTSNDGTLSQPMIGGFHDGRGEFFDQESFQERMVFVRWVWSDIKPSSCRFEQSFSADGGKTWEVNWINVYTRVAETGDETH